MVILRLIERANKLSAPCVVTFLCRLAIDRLLLTAHSLGAPWGGFWASGQVRPGHHPQERKQVL
jgi:hypothetical protein